MAPSAQDVGGVASGSDTGPCSIHATLGKAHSQKFTKKVLKVLSRNAFRNDQETVAL